MTPQELKNSILQLAIQGKLVEQRPEEGTAAELLEKILATKNAKDTKVGSRVPRDRNGRAVAPRPPIPDDEKPFDIPENWEWVRLGEVCEILDSKRRPITKSERTPGPYPYYGASCIQDYVADYIFDEPLVLLGEDGAKWGRGDNSAFRISGKTWVNNHAHVLRPLPEIDHVYLVHTLCILDLRIFVTGTTVPKLNQARMCQILLPLPPLAEQKRIVAKIEELLPLIDRYEKAWSKLEDFNKRFPVDMQKSLLQMAIQGKLVEQRPEEGTAAELLEKIARHGTHKTAGTHRTTRTAGTTRTTETKSRVACRVSSVPSVSSVPVVPPIPDDEKPFDIPESWKWVRLSQIAKAIVDCPHSTPKYLNRETEYCTIDTNCINEKGEIIKWRYVDAGTYQVRIARLVPQKDDIVYTREGSICRAAQLPDNKNICLGQRVMLVRCAHGMFPQFLRRMLMSPAVIIKLTEQQKGIGAKHVNVSDVCNLLIPLPPFAEQKRIVAKLEELLPLCERLKGSVPL